MSPSASIGHGLAVGILLAAVRAFGWSWEANALLLGALLLFPLAAVGGLRRRDFSHGPPRVGHGESVKIGIAALAVVVPSVCVVAIPGAPGFIDVTASDNQPVVLAMLLIALLSVALILVSGLIDWFYIRPQLRGEAGTVCATSFEPRWRGVTRIWLFHRACATLGTIAGLTALAMLAANSWIRPVDETVAAAVAGVATIIAGYYITRAAPVLAIAINPPVQVGDVIEIAEEYNVHRPDILREYFVVDVALEGVKLLAVNQESRVRRDGRDADRTHDRTIDVMDIGKLLRGRRPVHPCPSECQKLTEHCACDSPWAPVPVVERLAGW